MIDQSFASMRGWSYVCKDITKSVASCCGVPASRGLLSLLFSPPHTPLGPLVPQGMGYQTLAILFVICNVEHAALRKLEGRYIFPATCLFLWGDELQINSHQYNGCFFCNLSHSGVRCELQEILPCVKGRAFLQLFLFSFLFLAMKYSKIL
jgi:hypothetical protein